jgi:hypothetical protein
MSKGDGGKATGCGSRGCGTAGPPLSWPCSDHLGPFQPFLIEEGPALGLPYALKIPANPLKTAHAGAVDDIGSTVNTC